jgi:adenine-specific DNA-methyltransferase
MPVEYLGHKRNLLPFILAALDEKAPGQSTFADVFCGTGTVSAALKQRGQQVTAIDNLVWCATFTKFRLFNNRPPSFSGIAAEFARGQSRYQRVLAHLNGLPPVSGFIHRTYSPASAAYGHPGRMYFTEENAGRIDAIRCQIGEWSQALEESERSLLLSDLIRAANAVSNIAGTYGCYLKRWKARSLKRLEVTEAAFVQGRRDDHTVLCADAQAVAGELDVDVVYADPPYTKRQYAAYYHVLETIALGDEPEVVGATGLRPWREKSSPYCYRATAAEALETLVSALRCRHFFLSYSSDGQITHERILAILRRVGDVSVFETIARRYKSSSLPHRGPTLTERLYHVAR